MRLGFRHTAFQAVCTVLVLCFALGLLERADTVQPVFGEDTEQTQTLITDAGLPAPTCYTYPFGACSKESETLLKSMGFRCTLGCEERVNTVTRNPDCLFELGRFNRPAGQSTERFLHRALGED